MWYSIFNVSTLYIMYIIVLLACKNFPKKSAWIPILILFLSDYNNKSWKFQIQLEINSSKIWGTNILHWKLLFKYYGYLKIWHWKNYQYEMWRVLFTENLETESNQIDVVIEKVREVIKMESKNPAHLFHLLEIYRAIVILL